MTLGTFTPRSRVAGDKIDLRNTAFYNRPYLMTAVEYNDAFHSKFMNNGQGGQTEAVWVDVLDVMTGSVLVNVLFTNGAVVDNLKENVGTGVILPVKIVKRTGGQFGGYAALEALTDAEAAAAQQAYSQGAWQRVIEERARREAAAKPMGNLPPQDQNPFGGQGQAAPQQGGMFGQPQSNPFQGAQAPQGNPFGGQPPAQGGFAPASGFEQPGGQPQWNQQQAPAQGQFQQAPQGQPGGQFGAPQPAPGQFQDPNAPRNDPWQAPAQNPQQFQQGPNQGGMFGGQAPQGQFGQPAQGNPFQGDPNQGQFQQPNPGQQPMAGPQHDAAAQQALANLNSGQFS